MARVISAVISVSSSQDACDTAGPLIQDASYVTLLVESLTHNKRPITCCASVAGVVGNGDLGAVVDAGMRFFSIFFYFW
jgi:hypothetical protein